MAGRRTGRPPDPDHNHTKREPTIDGKWRVVDSSPNTDVPKVPDEIRSSFMHAKATLAWYSTVASLPQAKIWSEGDWFTLHTVLPLVDRYLLAPSPTGFASIMRLQTALNISTTELAKARIVIRDENEAPAETTDRSNVTAMVARRARLTS